MFSLTVLCTVACLGVLFFILGYLVWNGGRYLNWDFFTRLPAPVGESGGGMANAIVGSGKLLLLAFAIGVPIGLLGGIYLAEFGGKIFPFIVRYVTDLLNGVPSIVIGIFAYTLIVLTVKHFSTLAGGFALGDHDDSHHRAQHGGVSAPGPIEPARGVAGAGGDAVADDPDGRGAGRAARHPHGHHARRGPRRGRDRAAAVHQFRQSLLEPGFDKPTASLPVMIFTYAIAPYEDWHRQAWAAGFVLLAMVFVFNLAARGLMSWGRGQT